MGYVCMQCIVTLCRPVYWRVYLYMSFFLLTFMLSFDVINNNIAYAGRLWCRFAFYRQHCAQRKQPVLLRGWFWVFRSAGATRCTDWGEIWRGRVDLGPVLHAKFYRHRCNNMGIGPPNAKFLLRFYQKLEYKHHAGRIRCEIFTKFIVFVDRSSLR